MSRAHHGAAIPDGLKIVIFAGERKTRWPDDEDVIGPTTVIVRSGPCDGGHRR
jgi:hypothetical protein